MYQILGKIHIREHFENHIRAFSAVELLQIVEVIGAGAIKRIVHSQREELILSVRFAVRSSDLDVLVLGEDLAHREEDL